MGDVIQMFKPKIADCDTQEMLCWWEAFDGDPENEFNGFMFDDVYFELRRRGAKFEAGL